MTAFREAEAHSKHSKRCGVNLARDDSMIQRLTYNPVVKVFLGATDIQVQPPYPIPSHHPLYRIDSISTKVDRVRGSCETSSEGERVIHMIISRPQNLTSSPPRLLAFLIIIVYGTGLMYKYAERF
jgi:hypothetical protein